MSFDDLRNEVASQSFDDEEEAVYQPAGKTSSRKQSSKFLGMTSIQRFVIVFLLMLAVCAIGPLCLFATGKISI